MRGKEQNDIFAFVLRKFIQFVLNAFSKCFDEQRMSAPSVNDAPLDASGKFPVPFSNRYQSRYSSKELKSHLPSAIVIINGIKTGPGCSAAVLRILREDNHPLRCVLLNLFQCILGQRVHIPETNVWLVGRGLW